MKSIYLMQSYSCDNFFAEVFDEDKCPPVFLEKPKPWSGKENSQARFSCKVDGVPLPVVEWLKDGDPIRPGGRFKVMFLLSDLVY